MPSSARPGPSPALLRRQRAAAERLRRDVLGGDAKVQHYFRAYRRQTRAFLAEIPVGRLLVRCARADVVYVGDFHAVPACQRFASRVMEAVARDGRKRVDLGVEFVYTRQQDLLDRFQGGRLAEDAFLRRIHYREEWGYPWDGFRDLLGRAAARGVRVVALDRPPRGGSEGLARRDEHAAQVVAASLLARPRRKVVVLFGDSHLARPRMPRRVERIVARLGRKPPRAVTVFQDPDGAYWDALGRLGRVPEAVSLGGDAYAVFHGTPLEKYEAYRQVLEGWRGDAPGEQEVDLTPGVHHLITVLLAWLGIRASRRRVRHRAGWGEDLLDAYPEVYGGAEAVALVEPILADHGRTPAEIADARRALRERGAVYDSRSYPLFLTRDVPGRAAGEAARFLRAALSGRLFGPDDPRAEDPAERAYGAAYNEALAFLGSAVVDPAGGPDAGSPRGEARRARPFHGARKAWLEAHAAFERSAAVDPPERLLAALRGSRRLRRYLGRDLGERLGGILFRRVLEGRLTGARLRAIFSRPLPPGKARQSVIRLLRA